MCVIVVGLILLSGELIKTNNTTVKSPDNQALPAVIPTEPAPIVTEPVVATDNATTQEPTADPAYNQKEPAIINDFSALYGVQSTFTEQIAANLATGGFDSTTAEERIGASHLYGNCLPENILHYRALKVEVEVIDNQIVPTGNIVDNTGKVIAYTVQPVNGDGTPVRNEAGYRLGGDVIVSVATGVVMSTEKTYLKELSLHYGVSQSIVRIITAPQVNSTLAPTAPLEPAIPATP
jgi:hypothetical protein